MKKFLTYILAIIFLNTHLGLGAFAQINPIEEAVKTGTNFQDDVFRGHAEINDQKAKENEQIFTGEIEQLEPKDIIKMTVSQVLSSGFTEEGDEFFAEISSDVESDKGVILPAGTIAHGCVKEIQDSKRMGRDGWIEVSFDYLITPDGREIPIEGQMSTKLNPVAGTTKAVAKSAGYTVAGGAVGGLLALNMFGLPAAVVSQGYTLAGGAAVGGAIGLGMALYKKGKDVLISQGDEIRVKITKEVDLPVFKKEALMQEEFTCEGLNVKITNIDFEKDPFGEPNTITIAIVITNITDKYFTGFDICLENDLHAKFYPSVFGDTTILFSKIKPGDRVSGRISFAVDNVKRKHWLIFNDRAQRKQLAKISIDNAYKEIQYKKDKKKNKKQKEGKIKQRNIEFKKNN